MSYFLKLLRNPHFWIISAISIICVLFHYPEQIPLLKDWDFSSIFGLSRHVAERILFLVSVVYAGYSFGFRGGLVCLIAALAAMLPRAITISPYRADALFEILAVTVSGGLINLWLETRRREVGSRQQALLTLETLRRELQSYIEVIKKGEKRLSILHAISTVVNRSLVLEEVLGAAADRIIEVMDMDVVLLFIFDEEAEELILKSYRGISTELAHAAERMGIESGLNGWVVRTGEPLFVEDTPLDPRMSLELAKQEGIRSQFIVPLRSRDKIVGTLCTATQSLRQFTSEEKELLTLIGVELGIAIEKASLYQKSQLDRRRFQELFEKAQDAIWIEDMGGNVISANQAVVALTGYELEELNSTNPTHLLTPHGIELAREVHQKLLHGETVKQPYEQRIIKKDGTEAILMLTTTLLGEKGQPRVFQCISRDVTKERQLQEDLHLYIRQITRAHEEERNRISRELHDDTIQSLIAISHRLDTLVSSDNAIPKKLSASMGKLQKDIDDILQGIRRFTQDLRPPTLEYLGLFPALRELVSQIRKEFGLSATLTVNGIERAFTKEGELLIYRIIQEALRNVWRHSEATKVDVTIEFDEENTRVTVSDNGKGFEYSERLDLAHAGKLGLMGMQERASLLGGTLTILSTPGKGTTISLDIPRWCNLPTTSDKY